MPFATDAQVEAILDWDPSVSLDPFIAAADTIVQNLLVPIYGTSATAIAQLTQIEIWLSAHMYAIMRPRTNEEEADRIRDRFDAKVDLGLKVTRYGQMALLLDTTGTLAQFNYQISQEQGIPRPNLTWLGTPARRTPPFGWPNGYPGCW